MRSNVKKLCPFISYCVRLALSLPANISVMKLNVLICTYNEGIARIPDMLLAPRQDVSYIISLQYTDESFLRAVPEVLHRRADVRLLPLEGKGLCRNRNNALNAADGDIALIADDDCRYCDEYFNRIIKTFTDRPDVDIAQFKIHTYEGIDVKPYRDYAYSYRNNPKGMYPTSAELALRVASVRGRVCFDERLGGLGTDRLPCGEEDILLHDAMKSGLSVWFFPYFVVDAPYESTGHRVYTDRKVMMAQGAVNYHIHGWSAWLRMVKFALVGACRGKGNFFRLLNGACSGIVFYKKVIAHENIADRRGK